MKPAGYLRVSDLKQVDKWSLSAQESAIRRRCAEEGWPAPALYREAGRSAYSDDYTTRPQFVRLLTDVEAGLVDVVLVVDSDRLARSIVAATSAARRLEAAGCRLVSFDLPGGVESPAGWMMFSIKAAVAEHESAQRSVRVRAGMAAAREAGHWLGRVPYGARREGGRLALDPATAPTLRRLLERVAAVGRNGAARELAAAGVAPPGRGASWYPATVGRVVARGRWLLAQPDPWPALWLAARGAIRPPEVRGDARVRMLSGLLRCPCGASLQYNPPRVAGGSAFVRCTSPRLRVRGSGCPLVGTRTRAAVYEAQVTAALLALPDPADWHEPGGDGAAALAELEEDRRRLLVAYRARLMADEEFERERLALDVRAAALGTRAAPGDELRADFAALRASWGELSGAEQNRVLRELVDHVLIDGHRALVAWRPEYAALFGLA